MLIMKSAHHEVYIVVFISEVFHQLLEALFLSTHLEKNHHVYIKLHFARKSIKNV